ncbi:hypothetical protein N0B51_13155 [Tsuneonella sp. YG55]|uniref:Phosphatidate cytidylyltransferase n=1 Tax=Tsuneonella litorea TaxID=2976475 RepID=A0A9X2W2S4_9SPHN|nr:hypothetical protein [Tsuneonella litorea]MCT2559925.1 hypothetical protein [Tsuneonella litorea]
MSGSPAAALRARIAGALDAPVDPAVAAIAAELGEEAGARAVLFYGSNLRTGSLEGVLDFYVLLPGPQRERIWPRVSYREWDRDGTTLRAKIATMALDTFARAAAGRSRDTTIWARFVQPSGLVWTNDEASRAGVIEAIAGAAQTAARLAAALGPAQGRAEDFWRALFRATYEAEFRVEKAGRESDILSVNAAHFDGLLPLAWEAAGIAFGRNGDLLAPRLAESERRRLLAWWRTRARLGKPLNLLRLAKASTTFDGAAAYAAWKVERHTGVRVEVTPWREKHPLLAAPGVLWRVWRTRRKAHM